MEALAKDYMRYAMNVNQHRELIITEGSSAMSGLMEHIYVATMRKLREQHHSIVEENIKRYGKLKNFSKNI